MINKQHEQLSVTAQCELMEVNKATLYYKPKQESAANKELMNRMDELFTKRPFYGARRIQKELSTVTVGTLYYLSRYTYSAFSLDSIKRSHEK